MNVALDPAVAVRYARAALTVYGLPEATSIELLNISENATFRLTNPDSGDVSVLRVERPNYSTVAEIDSEIAWTEALRLEAGVRTASVIEALDGSRVVTVSAAGELGPLSCAMFEWLEGTEPPQDHWGYWYEQLGEISARMHRHSRAWQRPPGFIRRTWDVDSMVGPDGIWGSWLDSPDLTIDGRSVLERAVGLMSQRLDTFGRGPDRFGLVHADLRLANLLVGGGQIAVIDFDDSGYSWFMYDVATALTFLEHTSAAGEIIDAWKRGYRRGGTLPEEDEAEIPTFVMLRRLLVLAWITSHDATETAATNTDSYCTKTVELAERYLSNRLVAG